MPKTAVLAVLHNVADKYPEEVKAEILKAIGDIDHIEVYGQEMLVASFIQSPYIGATTLLKGEKDQNEDKWQSKSFMVLKLGDEVEEYCKSRKKPVPKVGEWYFGDVKEHWQLNVRGIGFEGRKDPKEPTKFIRPWGNSGWPCRLVLVGDIRGACNGRPQDIV